MRLTLMVLIVAGLLMLAANAVFADQSYHTERLLFSLTEDGAAAEHPELRNGQVINIHPNGPVNGAIELYRVNGAMPNTEYQVALDIYWGDCGGPLVFDHYATGSLVTDKHGNAHAQHFIPRQQQIDLGFTDVHIGATWVLVAGGVDAYTTECTNIYID